MAETTFFTFHSNIVFDTCIYKIYLNEAPSREEKNIKVLFREFSQDNPHKEILIVNPEEGVLGKHIREKFNACEQNGKDINTPFPSVWY